jgi:putative FmdB family regulatory protein
VPLYEYRCKHCGKEFEKVSKVGDPNPPCPEGCQGESEKLISRTSFVLNGGGWAVDNYSGSK